VSSQQRPTANSREALASLCRSYWYRLYAYVRRQGESVEDAQDLTQGFFSKLLEKHYLDDFDRERGRFRTFLLAAFRHYVANERNRERAQKRGGEQLSWIWRVRNSATTWSRLTTRPPKRSTSGSGP